MFHKLTGAENEFWPLFKKACCHEHVFGSKCAVALKAYGTNGPADFWVDVVDGTASSALFLMGEVLVISSDGRTDIEELAELIRKVGALEVDTGWDQCKALQDILGGTTESSFTMEYLKGPLAGDYSAITSARGNLEDVFWVLQQSHEYYRTHLTFDTWQEDVQCRLKRGLSEVYLLWENGRPVGTGQIPFEDDETAALAAVAVIPSCRGRGCGTLISSFLVDTILKKGKRPVLISGYDAVAELYRRVGFTENGRWGELYL